MLHNNAEPKVTSGVPTPKVKKPSIMKAWTEAQALIVKANHDGLISKAEALDLGAVVHKELFGSMGGSATSGNIKLKALKAPAPVKLDQPKQTPTTVGLPKGGKAKAGATGKPSNKGSSKVKKDDAETASTLDVTGEISKLNEDKQQCFGWCSVAKVNGKDVIDKQNDMIHIDDIEEAAYDYVQNSRLGGDMHQRDVDGGVLHKADMIESFVLTPEKIAKMGLPDTVAAGLVDRDAGQRRRLVGRRQDRPQAQVLHPRQWHAHRGDGGCLISTTSTSRTGSSSTRPMRRRPSCTVKSGIAATRSRCR